MRAAGQARGGRQRRWEEKFRKKNKRQESAWLSGNPELRGSLASASKALRTENSSAASFLRGRRRGHHTPRYQAGSACLPRPPPGVRAKPRARPPAPRRSRPRLPSLGVRVPPALYPFSLPGHQRPHHNLTCSTVPP